MKRYTMNMSMDSKFNPMSKDFWVKIVVMTIAIWLVSLTSLAHVENPLWAILAALIISLLNAFLRPVLSLISLPLMVMTFGLFSLAINAIIVLLTSLLLKPNFMVEGFFNALLFSIVITVLSFLMNIPIKLKKVKDDIYGDNDRRTTNKNIDDNYNKSNQSGSNRFDSDPFNDNPKDKNYTDYEDVD